jgi:predicted DCC family thiol-disulfide oxidoreductase YuxK
MTTVMVDADCGLCTRLLSFVHPRLTDLDAVRFIGLDTDAARRELGERYDEVIAIDTLVVVEGNRLHLRSAAALRLAGLMRLPWRLLGVFGLVPTPIRDAMYRFVAQRRGWFGPAVACPVDLGSPRA